MRRLFWMAAGATVTVVAIRRFSRLMDERVPPEVRAAASTGRQAVGAARSFVGDVRAGMAAREEELRSMLFTRVPDDDGPRSAGPRHGVDRDAGDRGADHRRRPDGRVRDDEPMYEF